MSEDEKQGVFWFCIMILVFVIKTIQSFHL